MEEANVLVNLLVELAAALDVVRRKLRGPQRAPLLRSLGWKSATYALVLQVSMEPIGKLLVFGRIADEAGVELDRRPQEEDASGGGGHRHYIQCTVSVRCSRDSTSLTRLPARRFAGWG